MTKNLGFSDLDNLIVMNNIIENILQKEDKYFFTKNFFEINFIELDNMAERYPIKFKIESLFQKKLKYDKIHPEYVIYAEDVNKIKEEKQNQEELDDMNESMNESRLPSENIFNRNIYLRDLDNGEPNNNKKKKHSLPIKEKFNLRMVFIKFLLR